MELTLKTKDGRAFHLEAVLPYTRQDGSAGALAVWRGTCRVCGAPFELTTSGALHAITRSKSFGRVHCDAHKQRRKTKATPQQSEGDAESQTAKGNQNETTAR